MLLTILALGTAVYLAMRLANESALAGFARFSDTLTQNADWTLRPTAGALPETALGEMRDALGQHPVVLLPIIEATVVPHQIATTAGIGSRPTWKLAGIDLIALQNLRGNTALPESPAEPKPRSCFVSAEMAKAQGWSPGATLEVIVNDQVVSLHLAGIIPTLPDAPKPPDHWLLMDLPEAQSLLQRPGEVDRVEVITPIGAAFPHLRAETQQILGHIAQDRWQVISQEDRRALADNMTQAFRLNLTVLSLLALLVGGYLMFQALDGVVIRRREEIAILRSLGVTEKVIQRAFLAEAGILGLVAGALGVLMGWAGAQLAVSGVAQTMTALYGASSVSYATLRPSDVLLGIGLCVITSLAAAWWPARLAASTPPAQVLSRHARLWSGGKWWQSERLGLLLCGAAIVLAQLGPIRFTSLRLPLAAYLAALLWLLGAGLLAGSLLRLFLWRKTVVMAVASSYLRHPSVRHRFAVAALTSAIAMTTGMAIMIASFDTTMRSWVERSMKADIYLSSAGAQSASSTHVISADRLRGLQSHPGVAEVAPLLHTSVNLPTGPMHVLGAAVDFTARHDLYAWIARPTARWQEDSAAVLINESLSERLQLRIGSSLELPTAIGSKTIRVAGIYADYGNEHGSVTLPQARFQEWFKLSDAWRVALMVKSGVDAETLAAEMQRQNPGLSVFSQRHLRGEAIRIFRQTFAVTYALEAVGVVVAIAGLGLALASLMLDRKTDLTTLRSLGFSARQLARSCAWEGVGLAVAGVVVGITSGLWLGWLLIYRVNKQSFGWTLSFDFPAGQMLALGFMILSTGAIISAFVGQWSARLKAEQHE
jgi:putative ABC transport system permease protein